MSKINRQVNYTYFEFMDVDSTIWEKYPGFDIYDAAEGYASSRDDEGYLAEGGEITCSARKVGSSEIIKLRITGEASMNYYARECSGSSGKVSK